MPKHSHRRRGPLADSLKQWLRHGSGAAGIAILSGFCLVLSEWLFFVTKPSFLMSADLAQHVRILTLTPWVIALPLLVIGLAGSLSVRFFSMRLADYVMALAAAALLTVLAMLMLDNFTYTVFGVRSFDLTGPGRYTYLAAR
jgi:hypothetical protein